MMEQAARLFNSSHRSACQQVVPLLESSVSPELAVAPGKQLFHRCLLEFRDRLQQVSLKRLHHLRRIGVYP